MTTRSHADPMAGRSRRGRSRRTRILLAGLFLALPLCAGACTIQIGCRTYSLFEPGSSTIYSVDESQCATAPPPVVPESSLPILLPVAAAVLVMGTVGGRRVARRRRAWSGA